LGCFRTIPESKTGQQNTYKNNLLVNIPEDKMTDFGA